jgi:urease accessory protein
VSSTNASELETAPAKPGEARMQASLRLTFERDDGAGRTVLASCRQTPPLRVVRAFALDDGAAMAHLHNVSGGLLGGDDLTLAVEVGPRAEAQLTTTGATRIYRPSQDSAITQQRNEIRVAESGLLEYLPDAIIPFAGANFSQDTSIHLAPDAGLFWWEILAPGREAHNEIFDYECVAMQANLSGNSGRIAAERIRLEPNKYDISSPARMGPYLYCATFYVCREGVQARAWLELEAQLRQIANELSHRGKLRWGISTLKAHGLMIRCLATEGSDVLPGLLSLWDAAKFSLYGRHALPPRKVK